MNLWHEIRGALILIACSVIILTAAECWGHFGNPKKESTRKLIHVGGGLVCLFLPFLVKSPITALVLAISLTTVFAVGAKLNWLHSMHGVERTTRGTEFYPLAIFLVFVLAKGETWLFISSVLVLAIADAGAALIGSRYGSIRFTVEEETKSVEGSAIFLMIAFLVLHLTMLLLTDLPREVCVLCALIVAILVTGLEAISLGGADNLFVPIGACLILQKITVQPTYEVIYQTASLLGLCLIGSLLAYRRSAFNVGGAITFTWFTYACWSLGSEDWALPVLLAWFSYVASWRLLNSSDSYRRILRVRLITRALLVPFLLLLCANILHLHSCLYGPFLAALTTTLTIGIWSHMRGRLKLTNGRMLGTAFAIGVIAWSATAPIPWLLLSERHVRSLLVILVVAVYVALANAWIRREQPADWLTIEQGDPRAWDKTCWFLSAASVLLVIVLQRLQIIEKWNPAESSMIMRSY